MSIVTESYLQVHEAKCKALLRDCEAANERASQHLTNAQRLLTQAQWCFFAGAALAMVGILCLSRVP